MTMVGHPNGRQLHEKNRRSVSGDHYTVGFEGRKVDTEEQQNAEQWNSGTSDGRKNE